MTEIINGSDTEDSSKFTFPDDIFPIVRESFPALPLSPKEKLTRLIIDYNDNIYPNGTSSERKHVKVRFRWAREVLNYADSQGSDMPEELVQVARSVILETCSYNDNNELGKTEELEGKTKSQRDIFEIYRKFIPPALYIIGQWCLFGSFGLPVDKQKAIELFSLSAKLGYSRAYYRIASEFEFAGDTRKALKYYKVGLKQNDSACSFRLGMAYLRGHLSLEINKSQGLKYIRDASANSDPDSPLSSYIYGLIQLGELLHISEPNLSLLNPETGETTLSQVGLTAVERAAWLGFPPALIRMGKAWQGGERGYDSTIALRYFHLAAKQLQYRRFNGEAVKTHTGEAEIEIAKWFLSGSDEGGFKPNEEWAFKFSMMSAELGNSVAQFAIGYYYEVGIWVRQDLATAKIWYVKAASNDSKDAQEKVKELNLENPQLITRNHHERLMSLNGRNSIRSKRRYMNTDKKLHSKRFSSYDLDNDFDSRESRTTSPIKELDEGENKETDKRDSLKSNEGKPLPLSPESDPNSKSTRVSRKPVSRVPVGAKSPPLSPPSSKTVSPYSSNPTEELTDRMLGLNTDNQNNSSINDAKTKELPSLPAQNDDLDDGVESLNEDILSDTQKILGPTLNSSNAMRVGRKADWLFDNLMTNSSSAGFPFGYEEFYNSGQDSFDDMNEPSNNNESMIISSPPLSISTVDFSIKSYTDSDSSSTRTIIAETLVPRTEGSNSTLTEQVNIEKPLPKSYGDIYSNGYTSLDPASSSTSTRSISQSKKRVTSQPRKPVASNSTAINQNGSQGSDQLNHSTKNENMSKAFLEKELPPINQKFEEVGNSQSSGIIDGQSDLNNPYSKNEEGTSADKDMLNNGNKFYGQQGNNPHDTAGNSSSGNNLTGNLHSISTANDPGFTPTSNSGSNGVSSVGMYRGPQEPSGQAYPYATRPSANFRQQRPRSADYGVYQQAQGINGFQMYNSSQTPGPGQSYTRPVMSQGYGNPNVPPGMNNGGRSMSLANGAQPRFDNAGAPHNNSSQFGANVNSLAGGHQPNFPNANIRSRSASPFKNYYTGQGPIPMSSGHPPQTFNANGRPRSASPFKNHYPGQIPHPGYRDPNMRMKSVSPLLGSGPMGMPNNMRYNVPPQGNFGNPHFHGPSPLANGNHNIVSPIGGFYRPHTHAPPFRPAQTASDIALMSIPIAEGHSKRGFIQGGNLGPAGVPPSIAKRNNDVATRNNLLSQF